MRAGPADVSVIIPTYDRASTLPRAIDSVLAQTLAPLELIVVDDGSADDTERLVRDRYARVRYLKQSNAGVSAARNRGLAAARGSWLAFLDSDDEWRPRKTERQLAALAERPDVLVCHTGENWMRRGRRVNPGLRHRKHGGWMFRHCLSLCAISPSSVIIHRDVLSSVGTFDEELPACEDYDLWLRICSRYEVQLVDEPLVVKHGGHDDQLSRRFDGMDRFRIYALEKILASGALDAEQWEAARTVALEKLDIYLAGVRKRGRNEEVVALVERKRRLETSVFGE